MTEYELRQAYGQYRVWSGDYCGDTIAEVYQADPERVRWYAKQDTKLGDHARGFLGLPRKSRPPLWEGR